MSSTYIFESANDSLNTALETVIDSEYAVLRSTAHSFLDVRSFMTWKTLSLFLLVVFVVLNSKNMPFIYHMRILNAFRFTLRTQRPKVALGPSHIFQPIITSSTTQLMEIDFNLHKSNSSYFADADIARSHLVCTLFTKGIEQMRGGTGSYTGAKGPVFGLAIGAVTCSFKRELKPYEQYEMWTKILSWDEKWIYIVTHFVRKGSSKPRKCSLYPEQLVESNAGSAGGDKEIPQPATPEEHGKHLHATSLSKCVFKSGRKTISPDLMLQRSGLLPVTDGNETTGGILQNIEIQRVKGLEMAKLMATQTQQSLDAEFGGNDSEVLGKHSDGAGLVGVVSTFMQLAHLKKSQVV